MLLLVFGWVPLRLLDEAFPDTWQFAVVRSERCCVTVKSEAQLEDSSPFASFCLQLAIIPCWFLVANDMNDIVVGT